MIKKKNLKLPAFQNFTADRMSLVTPPNSNGWNIPLNLGDRLRFLGPQVYIWLNAVILTLSRRLWLRLKMHRRFPGFHI